MVVSKSCTINEPVLGNVFERHSSLPNQKYKYSLNEEGEIIILFPKIYYFRFRIEAIIKISLLIFVIAYPLGKINLFSSTSIYIYTVSSFLFLINALYFFLRRLPKIERLEISTLGFKIYRRIGNHLRCDIIDYQDIEGIIWLENDAVLRKINARYDYYIFQLLPRKEQRWLMDLINECMKVNDKKRVPE